MYIFLRKILRLSLFLVFLLFFNVKEVFTDQFLDGIYYDWSVFVLNEIGDEKKCFIASFPKKSLGNFKKKREPYLLITRYNDSKSEEISLYVGFEYKIGSNVYLSIDGKQYSLYTKNDIAWARTMNEDKSIIENLINGYSLKIRAESVNAEYVVDEYSLKGISRAYKRIKELCK